MIGRLCGFLLLLSLSPHLSPKQPVSAQRVVPVDIVQSVQIIYVQPSGETFTADEQAVAYTSVQAALDWWHELSPITTTLTITGTRIFTTTADVYDSADWLEPFFIYRNPVITVLIVDNSVSRRVFYRNRAAKARNWYATTWAVLHGFPGSTGLASTITHELGHILYDLPDLYYQACKLDIMCWPASAYPARYIGCVSLQRLGASCPPLVSDLRARWIDETQVILEWYQAEAGELCLHKNAPGFVLYGCWTFPAGQNALTLPPFQLNDATYFPHPDETYYLGDAYVVLGPRPARVFLPMINRQPEMQIMHFWLPVVVY
jgi:hypothetical protein